MGKCRCFVDISEDILIYLKMKTFFNRLQNILKIIAISYDKRYLSDVAHNADVLSFTAHALI